MASLHVRTGYIYRPPNPRVSPEPTSRANESKIALLIENRPQAILAPLILHFIYSLPPDWRVRFMGSDVAVAAVNKSAAIREHVRLGKLDLTYIPSNMSTDGQEMISRFLTTLWLYETVLQAADRLLVFQTDSMICANSKHNVDDYHEYDWVGAPWNPRGTWGGNGGLSLRNANRIIELLRNLERREDSEPEDVWLSYYLSKLPNSRPANGRVSLTFSGERHSGVPEHVRARKSDTFPDVVHPGDFVKGIDDWRDGYYEPMGYHTGANGTMSGQIWGAPDKRQHIWQYCPEVKMILDMDLEDYVPGNCGQKW